MSFINNLLSLISEDGITNNFFLEQIGESKSSIDNWKTRDNVPKGNVIAKISKYFHVPSDFLLETHAFENWNIINEHREQFMKECRSIIKEQDGSEIIQKILSTPAGDLSTRQLASLIDRRIEMVGWDGEHFKIKLKNGANKKTPQSSDQGEISIEEEVDRFLSGLSDSSSNTMMLDGKPASTEAIAAMRSALTTGITMARQMEKEKEDDE